MIGLNYNELKMHGTTSMENAMDKEKYLETKFKRSSLQKYIKGDLRWKPPQTTNTQNSE